MKITEETKLKELIPDGYELDPPRLNFYDDSNCSYEYIAIPVKQKPKKDLEWYAINYAEKIKNYSAILTNFRFYALAMATNLSSDFINNNYDEIPFEFRIGLFKYICDDLEIDNENMFYFLTEYKNMKANGEKWTTVNFNYLETICPKKYLMSLC